MLRLNHVDESQPKTKAKLHCANWDNGECLGIFFGRGCFKSYDHKEITFVIDKEYAGKPCVIKNGDECPYFTTIVKEGIPKPKAKPKRRNRHDNNARVG